MLSRRTFFLSASAALLAGCSSSISRRLPNGPAAIPVEQPAVQRISPEYLYMYRAMPEEKFPIPAVNLSKIDPVYYRQLVDYDTGEPAGTIVVDTPNRFLYLQMESGKAMRYGIGIGRAGFTWGGSARIAYKREWPTWTPPAEMIARQPETAKWRNGMPPGLENPLGARALYIFEGNKDTLYRVHGTSEDWSIGKAVSSGCVRLLQQDIIDLYNRVPNNSRIVVRQDVEVASGFTPAA
ncbi:L,D-transpeptidase [Roseibium sp. RKSG952]|uniref:L,D-transpeptidase n=1 Tax=Roseibium sp. RKSG952 TaxID=2529384 RepID=UPI0012BD6180|nr:L,D-transpeptidase [Roseibium sp. RKSG952]MTH99427.1 L,D-transpeptidase [Roseibium sp. RKSG952]